jgi:hypothetical protein
MSSSNGVYRTPLLKNRIPEPEPVNRTHSDSALAAAHWDGRLNCRLAIDIGAWGELTFFKMYFYTFGLGKVNCFFFTQYNI